MYAFSLENKFWYDIGKPEDYIKGQGAYLTYYDYKSSRTGFSGNNLIHEDAVVGENCSIGPNVVIGPGCKIENGCRLKNCTLIGKTAIGQGVYIDNSIISWKCKIGNWARIEGLTVFAEEVTVKD